MLGESFIIVDDDALLLEGGLQIVEPAGDLLFEHGAELGVDGVELLSGGEAIDGAFGDVGMLLALEPPYPLHEEFVEVGGKDGEESGALEEGDLGVFGELENAVVEIEPARFAVEIFFGGRCRGR